MASNVSELTEEEKNFLSQKAKEVSDYCAEHGIFLLDDRGGLHALKASHGYSIFGTGTPLAPDEEKIAKDSLFSIPLEMDTVDDIDDSLLVAEPE